MNTTTNQLRREINCQCCGEHPATRLVISYYETRDEALAFHCGRCSRRGYYTVCKPEEAEEYGISQFQIQTSLQYARQFSGMIRMSETENTRTYSQIVQEMEGEN